MLRHMVVFGSLVVLPAAAFAAIGDEVAYTVANPTPPSAGSPTSNDISIYDTPAVPQGTGFTFRDQPFFNASGVSVDALGIGDADNNNVNELYVVTHTTGVLQLVAYDYVNNSGTLSNPRTIFQSLDTANNEIYDIAVGDADNNGSQEILMARRNGGFHAVTAMTWDGVNAGVFGTDLWSNVDGYKAYGVAIGDLRNTGTNLLAIASGFSPNTSNATSIDVASWTGVGTATFAEQIMGFGAGTEVNALAIGDPDEDGLNEVLIANGNGGAWQINHRFYNGATWGWDPQNDTSFLNVSGFYVRALDIGNVDNIPAIPEPTALAGLAIAGLALMRRR